MEDQKLTLEAVREQVEARVKELARAEEAEAPAPNPAVVARDEALERLCSALSYLENSLAEVRASRAKVAEERDAMVREAVVARGDLKRVQGELERERERAACIEGEVERQRAKQQRAFLDNKVLRDELRSLRLAHREVTRQEPLASSDANQLQSC